MGIFKNISLDDKTIKKIWNYLLFFAFIVLLIYSTVHEKTRLKNENYEGEIIAKSLGGRNNWMEILKDNKEVNLIVPNVHKRDTDSTLFKVIEPGDYIIKRKGEYKYSLIKGSDTIAFYVDTAQKK